MEVDYGRNCYSCKDFGHLARNCRNQRIVKKERRLEYKDNMNTGNNLNREKSLVVLD